MSTQTVYNKILIREHPDLSPVDDPSFQKGHSFIFPGDELVMCSIINSSDLSGVISQNKLTSVKLSVIAKKPNIFTAEFNRVFKATRWFELDSVVIPINSLNAPIVPWGTDGYAPNLNFTQDRNWQLPLGDFRRQIKAFTTHVSATSVWKYNFWFPLIFREDYWNSLLAADNDFYDITKPNNGKNQKWLRYHDLSALPFGWLIKLKIELNYNHTGRSIAGHPSTTTQNTITSEWNLSNEQIGIQDYESNPDYSLTEIKTCQVGGTPDILRPIFGSENTSCFGYFTKQTAWNLGEKDNLSAIFRIRPTEGGYRLGSRASSQYPITADVVWTGVKDDILFDDDDNIDFDDSDEMEFDDAGAGVVINFDPLDDKNIILQAEIDYKKLAIIFPSVKKFTLYCRLYNGTKLIDPITSS